jgi:hypothetical protein
MRKGEDRKGGEKGKGEQRKGGEKGKGGGERLGLKTCLRINRTMMITVRRIWKLVMRGERISV